ncbi:hypothetical protein [Sphingobacterium cellulitidis]|nr:hypothetical protein [Sphingobacterium soli]MBA8986468.1 hypothetical protein [Sphingobacterium soli]
MKKFRILYLIPLIMGCASNQGTSSKPPKIIGNWQWLETSGGFAGIKKTPESSNEIKHLQITKDSIFYYENGELTSAQPYKLKLTKSMLNNKDGWLLNENPHKVFVQRQDSTLLMQEDCFDCFSHRYVKMKER